MNYPLLDSSDLRSKRLSIPPYLMPVKNPWGFNIVSCTIPLLSITCYQQKTVGTQVVQNGHRLNPVMDRLTYIGPFGGQGHGFLCHGMEEQEQGFTVTKFSGQTINIIARGIHGIGTYSWSCVTRKRWKHQNLVWSLLWFYFGEPFSSILTTLNTILDKRLLVLVVSSASGLILWFVFFLISALRPVGSLTQDFLEIGYLSRNGRTCGVA